MPTKVFNELDQEKKDMITEAAIKEFAEFGYEKSSTNRIVRKCGISKGSLFKYFQNKEELYLDLIGIVSAQMEEEMRFDISRLPADLFERVIAYSSAEIFWYAANPVEGKLIIGAAAEQSSDIGMKIQARYGKKSRDMYDELLEGADISGLHNSREEISAVLRWVLQGFNDSFLLGIPGSCDDISMVREEYIKQLKKYLEVLKNGL